MEPQETTLDRSVWHTSLVMWTPPVGQIGSWILAMLFAANLVIQFLFMYLLAVTSLTQPNYNDELVGQVSQRHTSTRNKTSRARLDAALTGIPPLTWQYREWRRNQAHSFANYEILTGQSLSFRVCNGDVLSESAVISQSYGDVDEYLGGDGIDGRCVPLCFPLASMHAGGDRHRWLL